jgi:hypothetical protein
MKFYQEPNGDYLVVDTSTRDYYAQLGRPNLLEGRSTGIEGLKTSVCTGAVSSEFLSGCKRVKQSDVPKSWLRWLV